MATSVLASATWLVLAFGCGANPKSPPGVHFGQVVFDCYYVNFAWGYTLRGSYVDRDGRILMYDRKGEPWLPESVERGDRTITAQDLLDKFRNTSLVGRVEADVLRAKLALVEPASRGKLTREQRMNDAGGYGCSAYLHDPTQDSYQEIILASDGDWAIHNSTPEARALHQWLTDLLSQASN